MERSAIVDRRTRRGIVAGAGAGLAGLGIGLFHPSRASATTFTDDVFAKSFQTNDGLIGLGDQTSIAAAQLRMYPSTGTLLNVEDKTDAAYTEVRRQGVASADLQAKVELTRYQQTTHTSCGTLQVGGHFANGATVNLSLPTSIGAHAIRATSVLNVGGSGNGGSTVALAVSNVVTRAANASNEIGSLFSSLDETAGGSIHPTIWGLDVWSNGYKGNEQNRGVNTATFGINNYYNGDPSLGAATVVGITTKRNSGHEPTDINTYPIAYGLQIYGKSEAPSGTFGLGFTVGVRVGGNGAYWWAGAANSSRIGTGIHVTDWGQYGLRIGARYSGAAESAPFALWIENNGILVSTGSPTTASEGLTFGTTNAPTLYRSADFTLRTNGTFNCTGLQFDDVSGVRTVSLGVTNGVKIGASASEKMGFYGVTPVAQPSPYTVTNHTNDRTLNETADNLTGVKNVLGTLINDLKSLGLVG
jgi:hypothetical protein